MSRHANMKLLSVLSLLLLVFTTNKNVFTKSSLSVSDTYVHLNVNVLHGGQAWKTCCEE